MLKTNLIQRKRYIIFVGFVGIVLLVAGILYRNNNMPENVGDLTPETTTTLGLGVQESRPPHIFVGTVTINGVLAPEGTKVDALIDGVIVSSTFVRGDGRFVLQVAGTPGRTINFRIGTSMAQQKATLETGGADILNLSANQ